MAKPGVDEMIDPTQGISKRQASDPATLQPPRADTAREREAGSGAEPEVHVAERQKQVPSQDLVLDVRLDGETMRLYTELRDPETDRVLMRLPAVYQDEAQKSPPLPGTSFEA
jgi:hypothetical protein